MRRRIHRAGPLALLVLALSGPAPVQGVGAGGNVTQQQAQELVDRVVPHVEELRGLSFKEPVRVEVVGDAAMREYVLARLRGFGQEQHLEQLERAYELLGLVPRGTDLLEQLLGAMEEQAGGYYDPTSGAYYLLDDMPLAVAPILTAHELTHALEDQHYDLDGRLREVLHDDDRMLAQSAVHEGSATLVMSVYTLGAVTRGEMDAGALLELAQSEAGRAEKLSALPDVLLRQLLGPYVLGALFLSRENPGGLVGAFPQQTVDSLMTHGPTSTEQLLHPEKYWDEERRDEPGGLGPSDAGRILGRQWTRSGSGVLGELTLAALVGARTPFEPGAAVLGDAASWTHPAASGWDADRWEVWRRGDAMLLLLSTAWDTPEDAGEFAAALPRDTGLSVKRADARVAVVAGDAGKKTRRLLSQLLRP